MLALILSILFPGLGQFYCGRNVRGVLMVLLGVTPLYPVALIWSIIDILILNRKGMVPRFDRGDAVRATVLLLVVVPLAVAILVAVTRFAAVGYARHYGLPRSTERECGEIAAALEKHRLQTGRYPESLAALAAGRPPRSGWTTDAWGRSYAYAAREEGFTLASKGGDGEPGTKDDIDCSKGVEGQR